MELLGKLLVTFIPSLIAHFRVQLFIYIDSISFIKQRFSEIQFKNVTIS